MSLTFSVSPDFNTKLLPDWFVFNNWLQKTLNTSIHFETYNDFETQHRDLEAGKIDMIYANPYDATSLIRKNGFSALTKPRDISDEAIIAVNSDTDIHCVEDLQPGACIATTDDPDVHLMGLIMLEPADLDKSNIELLPCENYVLIAKQLFAGKADAGFFLTQTYNDLSNMIRDRLRILVQSQISVIHHMFMIRDAQGELSQALLEAMVQMHQNPSGARILNDLGVGEWLPMTEEDAEFMIDLMDTLEL